MSGKPELLLGSLNWLNRQNYLAFLNSLFIVLGIGFGALYFMLRANSKAMHHCSLYCCTGPVGISWELFLHIF